MKTGLCDQESREIGLCQCLFYCWVLNWTVANGLTLQIIPSLSELAARQDDNFRRIDKAAVRVNPFVSSYVE